MSVTIGHITITLRVRKPWWTGMFIAAIALWARMGLPLDPDKAAAWLARRFKVTAH